MNFYALIKMIDNYITGIFSGDTDKELLYHDLTHTQQVVANAAKIATHYKLNEKDYFIVIAAAWFHDIGYFVGNLSGHELTGADMAAAFLKDKGIDEETITAVKNCIMATRMPQAPTNLLEQIVCDADLFLWGTDEFEKRSKLMRKEAEWRLDKKITKSDWRKSTIHLLESHHFHTDYARQLLQDKKTENLNKLKRKSLDDAEDDEPVKEPKKNTEIKQDGTDSEPVRIKKLKVDRPNRGIETMFRITSGNNQRLSDMADNKAHIMITTTSIIISVLLSVLIRKLEENSNLIIPTMLLLFICVITMVFSILATRPSIPQGTFTQDDIDNKKTNLLFFGNFYRMNYDDYSAGMQQMMNDREFLYGSLTKDVYSQGVVLGRKYRLLRIAYDVFMFGIVLSVLAFVISSIFFTR
ncbi:MAG: Pycsar system effector family protein [Chitinophagaceae bacterium]